VQLQEEIEELQHEITEIPQPSRLHDELGDMLFCCVNIARHLNIDPEQALLQANQKFCKRFRKIEQLLEEQNNTMGFDALLELWEVAKSQVG
jgi:ATP diphosphatase